MDNTILHLNLVYKFKMNMIKKWVFITTKIKTFSSSVLRLQNNRCFLFGNNLKNVKQLIPVQFINNGSIAEE